MSRRGGNRILGRREEGDSVGLTFEERHKGRPHILQTGGFGDFKGNDNGLKEW